ncbi:MAG: 3',5' nucleotidase, exopolyphosphatase [uncultured archaeon A07HR60]|jgi:5''-nucleotidase (EC 3.1.3.5)/3''-nucleotidase (EC 3.1.3.6)/exopolyphosphatase (EC 3.6.1.11)|nr:MAG: 5''/3''-nucleotidase SurE [Halorubrum sp. J07HR59]ESS12782.1 MAG: 3',5' nucleotidase, exopolyphosphatase [uncultured archaeon A07HR60]
MTASRVLLTNDDGIDSVGLRALREALSEVAEVIMIAPADDQSAVGRASSDEVTVREHEHGYVVEGTPVDCVIAGLGDLVPDVDAVVSGCNKGANLGAYTLGRSGTISAAVEAAFFDVPAIAVSMYIPGGDDWYKRELSQRDYRNATEAARFLLDESVGTEAFETADYLNVNAPTFDSDELVPMEVTRPSTLYDMTATQSGDSIRLTDRVWDRMEEGTLPDPEGTDRRAVVEDRVSVSPLTAPHTTERYGELDRLVGSYNDLPKQE